MESNLLQFFEYDHLPLKLQTVSAPFHELAHRFIVPLPDNDQREQALRKLLEAKDCAVRSVVMK